MDELQELFAMSNPDKEAPVTVSYNFQMADAVGSVAPIADIALGLRTAVTFFKESVILEIF